jgi:glycosyltransferase involved in cell wall biosynthesis
VEHLFVLDPALGPYRNFAQSVFHNLFIRLFLFLSYRAADAVVAISAYVNKQILGVFPWLKPIIIYNGIDTDFFTPGPEHDERADNAKKRLLFMGLPSRRKGADLFPRIMSELGDGYELHYTSARGQDDALKGHPRIESIGWVDKHRARDAYRNADLLLFPSRLEGFGLVVAESLACGTPVIVSNSSSLPEIVQDGLTGKICDVDDVRCLTDAVRDFTSNREKMKQAGIEAREQATRHLSLDRMVREYLALFRRLVPDSRPCKQ